MYELLKFKEMKNDIKILIGFLETFTQAFTVTETNLLSEKEDKKMNDKIRAIAKKHGLKF